MGCEITAIKGATGLDPHTLWIEGQMLRGRFIDAFARLEGAVTEYLIRLEFKAAPRAPFSHKLKHLTAARDRFCQPAKLDDRVKAIGELNKVRADVVHAALTIIVQYDEINAIEHWLGFQNASYPETPLRVLSLKQLKQMTLEANQLATQFSQQRLKEATPAAPASASA
ncbi:hypothetical protein [Sphingopyxis witflariensis]|uniref:Uncharacterized protein n=1 Tax=Sphingopyxis witflariensis TaxID=173675 RepID=A0A246JZ83_9SPHN|nr:hypothetical protein [Sphingopyxis witflariensis]OWQ98410.1 hypothetical protein CDQ91_07990 [Sphingopyxis witflariensis]